MSDVQTECNQVNTTVEHSFGRVRINKNIKFRRGSYIAGLMIGTAHDHYLMQAVDYIRSHRKRRGNVGKRTGGDQSHCFIRCGSDGIDQIIYRVH